MCLQYSPEAINVLKYFDKSTKTIRILVEGIQDVPFYQVFFSSINESEYKIICQQEQGCQNIIKKLKDSKQKQKFIAILDSEYDEIIHNKKEYKSPFTIFTIRHSIENYLFCYKSFNQLIKKINQNYESDYEEEFAEYFEKFSKLLEPLLYYDCKKQKNPNLFKNGTKIMGSSSNICSLLDSKSKTYLPIEDKISHFITSNQLDNINVTDIKNAFNGKILFNFLNGHYILPAIIIFLNKKIKRNTCKLNKDNIYTYLNEYCINCSAHCKDYNNFKKSAEIALTKFISTID